MQYLYHKKTVCIAPNVQALYASNRFVDKNHWEIITTIFVFVYTPANAAYNYFNEAKFFR